MISFWFKEIFQRVIDHQSSVTGKMRLISLINRRIHRWLCCAGGIFCLLITKAYAENTVDVSFSAEMIPAACRVSLDNGGTVDYGTLSLSSIRSSSPYLLTPRVIGLHIQCESLRQVAWMVNDEKAETRVRNLISARRPGAVNGKKRALTPASHALLKSTPGVDFLTLPRQIKCEFDGGAIPLNLVILLILRLLP